MTGRPLPSREAAIPKRSQVPVDSAAYQSELREDRWSRHSGHGFLRSGDALHLACAEEHGFQEVYTNDRHMLKAARHFHLTGVNVLSENG
jgi:predicted nucleic acid-binding protein